MQPPKALRDVDSSTVFGGDRKPRLMIFVIAYYAEATLVNVLERIPRRIFDDFACEIVVVDDASSDRTHAIGRQYGHEHPEVRLTALRNTFNQGYGGNQKVGYTYAIQERFDFVAMVHGDGQYAPEELERLLRPLVAGEADVVFGSRMMERFAALRGGMPIYKYVGNVILTRLQNLLLRSNLSEFHSGYRIYSVAALSRIPYKLNSNDFHFDTQIIIQLLNAGSRIVELPIPTYYGDEISRVNGLAYARDVMLAVLQNTAHRAGILYQRRFDTAVASNEHYDLKLGYPSSHSYALQAVPANARVVDIGGGPGGTALELAKKGCLVTAVDRFPPLQHDPRVTVIEQDLEAPLRFDPKDYDYLLMLDIIEHLRRPEEFLERIHAGFDYVPKRLVLTTPNIAFVVQRLMLLLGQFNYGKAGILDRDHVRLFNLRSLTHLLRDAGFAKIEIRGVPAPFPKVLGNGLLGRGAVAVNLALIRISKTLFSYQFIAFAESTPSVEFIVSDTRQKSGVSPRT